MMGRSSPSILPITSADASIPSSFGSRQGMPRAFNANSRHSNSRFKLPRVVKRAFRPPTLDFETAVWEIAYLVISPRRVYKSLYYHKQTKNTWARDDPSFVILLSAFLTISAIAWGLAYSPGVLSILKLILYMVFVDFFAVGVLVATVGWLFANRFLKQKRTGNVGAEGELEWAYCFDVHCNSFLLLWVFLYVVQFVLLPVITRTNWISLFLGNTLYLIALSSYFYITFLGYSNMPFLEHTELLLFPVGLLAVLYLFSLMGFNMARTMVHLYFD